MRFKKTVFILFEIALLACTLTGCVFSESVSQTSDFSQSSAFPLTLQWKYEMQGNLSTSPLYAQGVIIERFDKKGSFDDVFIALDANTGELLWQYRTNGSIGFFEYLEGISQEQLILAGNSQVVAIDFKTGRETWRFNNITGIHSISASEKAVFVSAQYKVVALDTASGTVKWVNTSFPRYFFPLQYDPESDRVLVLADNFFWVDAQTGETIATLNVAQSDLLSNCKFLQLYNNHLYCETISFDIGTEELAIYNFGENDYLWSPLIKSNTMYLRSDMGTIKAVDLNTMTLKWEYLPQKNGEEINPEIISNISVMGTTGYAIADDATLRAFDIYSGEEVGWWKSPYVADWRTTDQVYITIPGVSTNGLSQLYVSFGDNKLYTFSIK